MTARQPILSKQVGVARRSALQRKQVADIATHAVLIMVCIIMLFPIL